MKKRLSWAIFFLLSLNCLLSYKTKAKTNKSVNDDFSIGSYMLKRDTIDFKTFEFTNEKIKDFIKKAIQDPNFQEDVDSERYLILSVWHEGPYIEHISLTYDMVFVRKYKDWFYSKLCDIPIFIHKLDLPISFIKTSNNLCRRHLNMWLADLFFCRLRRQGFPHREMA